VGALDGNEVGLLVDARVGLLLGARDGVAVELWPTWHLEQLPILPSGSSKLRNPSV
jgi:hypothetical protein